MPIFKAGVQYGDWHGTAAADDADVGANSLERLLEKKGQKHNGEFLLAASLWVTVMHPRGEVRRPDGPVLNRASVWIEQEIASPLILGDWRNAIYRFVAFKHKSVGREGIRDTQALQCCLSK